MAIKFGPIARGIVLEQHKEPALSREILTFFHSSGAIQQFEDPSQEDAEHLSPQEIVHLAHRAQIVDESDGKILGEKLGRAGSRRVTLVVVDAVDDEPYVSSQMCMLRHYETELLLGLALCQRALGVEKGAVAVYKNITDLTVKIPARLGDIPVHRILGRYPAQERIQDAFEGERVFTVGACALVHLARAARDCRIQTTCFLTVGGDCMHTQQNMEVSIGMPVSAILDRCGLLDKPGSVVIGGSMTGICVLHPEDTLISARTRAVLAFVENEKEKKYRCIGCARCVDVCPQRLTPFYLYKNIEHGKLESLDFYDIDQCIECGTCSYICPSKLDVAQKIIGAKLMLREMRRGEREHASATV